ncbi:S-layer homology domain-containing protein [Agathobaculum butyriciproducens]|uniref:S-layer homology domain-containing protein n=1 Tax=Agathobaculum butyriciproducens TaxID=1628085 RepID=UPI001D0840AD|nr:S-layer homology domain-containing protein [Agathobaculum butyriciproducens]MCQ5048039.1 S-layer homology domain-containing protein [Agathobaculum butyriciproducens]
MKKRITSLLLTLAMLLSLLPAMGVTASAAEPEWTTVNSYADLKAAVDKGSAKIKLTADIDTTSENSGVGVTTATNLRFKGSGNVLDLNGHKLKLVSNMSVYFIEILSSDLTIKDSSGTNGRIDFEYGEAVLGVQRAIVISRSVGVKQAGSLTVDSGTLSSTYLAIILIESYGSITINGGRLYAPVTNSGNSCYIIHSTNRYDLDNTLQLHVNGGELDGRVVLKRDDSSATGTLKYKVTPIKITGGTFKQGLYATWGMGNNPEGAPKNAEMTMDSPTVEITGGVFEKNNEEYSSYASSIRIDLPTKLRRGTFKNGATIRFVGGKYTWDATQPQYRASIGNSAILRGNDIRTAYDWSKSDWFEIQSPWIYLTPRGASVTVIPNAWGVMESVTLDGTKKINYAKDWKGAVEEMDNSTAHTIKFTWKPLAQELKDAGYSYRVECDRYISGNKTPTTDTISATATEYSFTIPAGADPKVYSFDLKLNLQKNGSNIGIFSNEHIVKLVVNQAPVVVPDPTLAGNVYYTSGIVYGRSISTGTGNLPTGFDSSKLRYQWQRSTDSGNTWKNIEGATSGKYTPVEADMGENVRIRVVVTANGYLGEIVGAAVKVSKADNNGYPEVIKLEAVKNDEGYTGFKITNFDSDCEYVYSTTDTPDWSKNQISSATVTGLMSDTTYYVFARFKGTATHTVGSIVSRNSIMLYDNVPLQHVLLEGYDGPGTNTIYIKQGESVTLKVSADPSNANSWNEITFKDSSVSSSGTSNITISNEKIAASTGTAESFPNGHSITITGNSKGSATLKASYSGTNNYYGTWNVVVYDDPADALRFKSVYAYEDITLSVNDTAELPTELPTLLPENSGYHPEWRIVKVGSGATYSESDENITLENGKIKPIKAHTGSASTRLELVAVNGTTVKSLSPSSVFNVTVTKAPTIALTGVTVAPTKVNLELNATCQLSAVKEPVNATGILNWESSNTGVATVDSNGKVTAVAKGEATITVSCGDKKATCTVTVAHTHDYTGQPWVYMDPGTHTKTCTAGDNTKYEPHNWQWVVETPATSTTAGKKHEECPDCHARRSENTVIPATGGGSSSGGGSSGGGGGAGVTTYAITVQNSKNGAVTASHKSAAKDTAVTLTVTPDKGYVLDTLNVLDSKNKAVKLTEKNGKYTFTMPAGKVTVSAAFKAAAPASENPFTDVPSGAYYEDAVIWAVKKGITSGTSATTFNPDGSCTRAQAVTFLWRAAGSPEPKSAAMPFTDVPAGSYFEKAVLWAVENGITKGTSDTTFSPDASCTRAQIVTFLWRAGGSPAVSGNSAFSDVAADAYYAAAVAWAEKNGVTGGIGGGLFGSDNTCTRAQIVTFLHRAMK